MRLPEANHPAPRRIVYVVGARPNFIKMAPVVAALRFQIPEAEHVIVHTGQHYDRMLSEVFIEELALPAPRYRLEAGSGSHSAQTARIMERFERVLTSEEPDLVIVPGDVNSTLATALVTAKMGISLAHIEGGLRSFDRTMPEEINRIVADEFADHIFVHCQEAVDNLSGEGIQQHRIHFVGNTMIDSLARTEPKIRNLNSAAKFGLLPRDYLLVTLHRPTLVDGPRLGEAMRALGEVARQLPVLFPLHPRTRRALGRYEAPRGVKLVEPVGYLDFLSLQSEAAAVVTDSGGVQEETTYLKVPCFTLRDNTERPVTIRLGTNTLLGLAPDRIVEIPELAAAAEPPAASPPLWDGSAGERVSAVIANPRPPAYENEQLAHRR